MQVTNHPKANDPGTEKPQNGLKGLKYFFYDLWAGFMVSLISLPFSLGIAIASGVPAIAGVYSAIIAGLILPFLGGSYVTISGPAVGLAPAILFSVLLLGNGDPMVGYTLALVAIFTAGLIQMGMAAAKLGRFGDMFPNACVKGMLIGIGLWAVVRQIPLIFGNKFKEQSFWGIVGEIPRQIPNIETNVFISGMTALLLMFGLNALLKKKSFGGIPKQLIVVLVATVCGTALGSILGISAQHLIHLPSNVLDGFQWPNFIGFRENIGNHTFAINFFTVVLMFVIIDSVESLATISAIDKDDPYARKSNPNWTLFAMGFSNFVSSMCGGLTIIPGGVKSKANIEAGGKTQWANFWNAICLIFYMVAAQPIIKLLPLSVLGAIVIFIGYKLCAPRVWVKLLRVGKEQFLIGAVTAITTVSYGIMEGIALGMGIKLVSILYYSVRAEVFEKSSLFSLFLSLFRNPIIRQESDGTIYHLYLNGPIVCFNRISQHLEKIPKGMSEIHFHFGRKVTIIDHTSADHFHRFTQEFKGKCFWNGRGALHPLSGHPTATRVRSPTKITANGDDGAVID